MKVYGKTGIATYILHTSKYFFMACLMFLLVIFSSSAFAQAEFNPKAIDTITLKITQHGTLTVEGNVESANITLYIPQDNVESMDVSSSQPMEWKYSTDPLGNRVAVLKWKNPAGIITYDLTSVVKSSSAFVSPTSGIGYDPKYLQSTGSIKFTDDIRKAAYPYEKSWANVARLTGFVYDYVNYDRTMIGERKDSAWVYQNKRGVCVEHANLLTALLRVSGIPARYVVGYAYSSDDKKLIGHTWVEVLGDDEKWIPFDPTWLQGGYLDATHIKTANLLDDSQLDVLSYIGNGKITWSRGDQNANALYADSVEILDYREKNLTALYLDSYSPPLGGYGYVTSMLKSDICTINHISAQSCVDNNNRAAFEIYEPERKFFSCRDEEIFWFFRESLGDTNYKCPVSVYDQIGTSTKLDIKTAGSQKMPEVSMAGPNTVNIGETFRLFASSPGNYIFYSPEFGRNMKREWYLSINRTGDYNFYLFDNGALAKKAITVVQKKEFEVSAEGPENVKKNQMISINVTVKNVDTAKNAAVKITFGDFTDEKTVFMNGNEEKKFTYIINATEAGQRQLVASVTGQTYNSYTLTINVEDEKKVSGSVLDTIFEIINSIKQFFENLLKR